MQKTDERAEEAETETPVAAPAAADDAPARGRPRHWPLLLPAAAVLPGAVLFAAGRWLDAPAMQAWRTVCLAISVQAMPFLLLGTALSDEINAFVPTRAYAPPALGAYTASRQPPKAVAEQEHFDPLPATSPVSMTLTDFRVYGPSPLPANTWVSVTGSRHPAGTLGTASAPVALDGSSRRSPAR